MAFYVYILKCADGSYYTGHTDNIEFRISQHQTGAIPSYTSTRLPVECVYAEDCGVRLEALAFEQQIKGWSRAKKETLIRGDWKRVSELAKSRDTHPSTGSGRTV
ncbi:MAG TPA: GIY-YIG nuclease family protein [Burkholderiales bacterium]|nr:GIY-YIG nuclease family protein [Burkholderiales bacterium]